MPQGTPIAVIGDDGDTHRLVRESEPLPVEIRGAGVGVAVGPFGEVLVANKLDDISIQFQYDYLNQADDLKAVSVTGDGSASAVDSLAIASSAANGTALIESRSSIRYRPGRSGYADMTVAFSGAGIGYAGPHDDADGFFFKYDDGSVVVGYRRDGADVVQVPSPVGFALGDIDWTKLNIVRVLFGFLGVASPVFMIKLGNWKVLHIIKTEGVIDTTHVLNPVFPMRIRAEDGCTVKSGSWNGGTFGDGVDIPGRSFHWPSVQLVGGAGPDQGWMNLVGTALLTGVIFRNRATYQGKVNKVSARMVSYAIFVTPTTTGEGTVSWQLIGNPVLSGAGTYVNVDTNNSIIEYDHTQGTGASVNFASGGRVAICGEVSYSQAPGVAPGTSGTSGEVDALRIGTVAHPGETFVLVVKDDSGNAPQLRFNVNWEELF